MKAAVINAFGEVPQYVDFPNPTPVAGEVLIDVKACVLENFDKGTASGKHYASNDLFPQFPAIVGRGGIGLTAEGNMIWFDDLTPPYGSYAEKAASAHLIPVPEGIDPVKAAAIPRATLTSCLPLKYSAKLQRGETVLINGATGVSGRIAVQVAKMLGAGKVIATGRNERSLELLSRLGADVTIDLKQSDEQLANAFSDIDSENPIDVVIDFIWGHPTEVLISTFIPREAGFAKRRVRYVQIGEKAGSHISLSGSVLRTSGLELMGIGKISQETLKEELDQVWSWIAEDKLYMEVEKVPLAKIAEAWQRSDLDGKRIVIVP